MFHLGFINNYVQQFGVSEILFVSNSKDIYNGISILNKGFLPAFYLSNNPEKNIFQCLQNIKHHNCFQHY